MRSSPVEQERLGKGAVIVIDWVLHLTDFLLRDNQVRVGHLQPSRAVFQTANACTGRSTVTDWRRRRVFAADSVHHSSGAGRTVCVHVWRNGADAQPQLLRLHHDESGLCGPIGTSRQSQGSNTVEYIRIDGECVLFRASTSPLLHLPHEQPC